MFKRFFFRKKESLFYKVEFAGLEKQIKMESQLLHQRFTTLLVKHISLMLETLTRTVKITDLIGEIPNSFQQLIENIHKEFSGTSRLQEMESDIQSTKDKQDAIDQEVSGKEEEVRLVKGQLDEEAESLRPQKRIWMWFQLLLMVLLTLDVCFNYNNLSILGLTQITSIASSALIGVALYFYVDQVPRLVDKLRHRYGVRKIVSITLSFIPPVGFFSLLANLRVHHIVLTQGAVVDGTVAAFVGINTLIYGAALLICYRYQLPKSKLDRFEAYENLNKKIKKEKAAIAALQAQKVQLSENLKDRMSIVYNAFQKIKSLEEDVVLRYSSTCLAFKSALLFRTNGKASSLFINDELDFRPLKLHYQDLSELFTEYLKDREAFQSPSATSNNNKLLMILLPLVLVFSACKQPKVQHIKFLIDRSEPSAALEQFLNDSSALIDILSIESLQDQQTVSVDYITDRKLANEGFRVNLPKGKIALFDNALERGDAIDSFKAQCNLIWNHIQSQPIGLDNSYILYHLHTRIIELIREQNDVSRLYIFTNGMEKSPWLDLYQKEQFKLFTTNENYSRSIFDQFPLDSVKMGKLLELHFIFQGNDKQEDEQFHTLIESSLAPYYRQKGFKTYIGRSIKGSQLLESKSIASTR